MEEALRESEEKFAKAFRSCPDPMCITTLKEGRCIDVNDGFLRTTGYQPEEVIGRTTVELSLWAKPEDRDRITRMVQTEGRVSNLELDFRMKSGQIHRGLLSMESVDLSGEPCLLTVVSDITERKRAEEELRRSEERYRLLFDNYGDPINVYDKDGRLLLINTVRAKNLGGRPEDFVGRSYTELFPEQGSAFLERHRAVALSGVAADFEDEVELPSGKRWFWSVLQPMRDENGNVYALQTISHDITERKRAENALRESEAKYAAVVEQAADGVVITQDGIIKFASNGHAQITGYSVAELVGMSFMDTVDYSNRDLVAQRYATRMAGAPRSDALETRILCRDGTVKEAEARSATIQYQGRPAVLSIVRDVTDRKKAEQELQRKE